MPTVNNVSTKRVAGGRNYKWYTIRNNTLIEQTDAPMMETDYGHFYEGTETQFDISAAQMASADLVEETEPEPTEVTENEMAFIRSFAGPRTGAGGYSRAIRNENGFVTVVVPHEVERPVIEQDGAFGWADVDYDGEGNEIETLMPGVDIRQMNIDDFTAEWAKARIEYARDEKGKIVIDQVSGEPVCQYVNWRWLSSGKPRIVPMSAILTWPTSSKPGVALSWFDAKKYADLAWNPKPGTDMEAIADSRWVSADQELRKALGSMVTSVGKTEIDRVRATEIMLEKGAKPTADERELAKFAFSILTHVDSLVRNMRCNDRDDEESGLVGMELPVAGGVSVRYVSVDALDVAEAAVSSGLTAYMGSVGQILRRTGDSATLDKRTIAVRAWRAKWKSAEADGFSAKIGCDAAFSALERAVVEAIVNLPVIERRYVVRDEKRVVEAWGAKGYVDASKELMPHMSAVIAKAMSVIMDGAVAGRFFSSSRRDGTFNVDSAVWSWLLSFAWKSYNTMTWYYQSFEKSVWTRYRIAAAVDAQLACMKIDSDRYEYLHADRNTSETFNKDGWSERNKSIVEASF